jgi:peroxiredoxin
MKRNTWIAVVVGLLVAGVARADGIKLGDKAPLADVKMKSVDGKELSIGEVAGNKGTLVVFSCNSCPFAQAWERRIVELGNTFRQQDVGVVMINANDATDRPAEGIEEMKKHVEDRRYEFPYVVDATSDVARAFGATRTPECYLFDKDGKLVYHGAVDDDKNGESVSKPWLRTALEAVVAGKEIADKETKAIGCGIKFHPKP